MALLSYPHCPVVSSGLQAGPEVPDTDPGPAPHQPAAGECVAVRARGADAPHREEPGAAEAAGGLPGPVPERSPEGAEQEVSTRTRGHTHTHREGHTHTDRDTDTQTEKHTDNPCHGPGPWTPGWDACPLVCTGAGSWSVGTGEQFQDKDY